MPAPIYGIIAVMVDLLLLAVGFVPLIYGAGRLVEGASSLAKRFNVPPIVIGLTIVAFGTSAPELVVNLFAAFDQNAAIVLGNVLGSNIFNILGIIGISALIYPLQVRSRTTWIEVPLSLLAAVVVLVMANQQYLDRAALNQISRSDGIVLLLFFSIFMAYSFHSIKSDHPQEEQPIKLHSTLRSWLYIVLGFVLLVVGGRLIVVSAVSFAQRIGIPERIIALTIISIGTSLPELATSAVAASKRNVDIAIGNIVGSNIFNIFFILGMTTVVYPAQVTAAANIDLLTNVAASLLLFALIFIGRGRRIDRREGALFVLLYAGYLLYLLH